MISKPQRILLVLVLMLAVSGCAYWGWNQLNQSFGPAHPIDREVAALAAGSIDFWQEVKPVLDNRCVVCHGCYDAPCQLKLTAIEGIDRGASKTPLYNNRRLLPGELTRLFEDAQTTAQWRSKDFFPVLNERAQTPEANRQAGVMYQMLALKAEHPLPNSALLSEDFTLGLGRDNLCPKAEEVADFTDDHPLWGMPYALPGLTENEQATLLRWLEQGATYSEREPLSADLQAQVKQWEVFFNQPSVKAQLVSRYLYEHLFLAHLYFSDVSPTAFFKLVRSATPPGQPVQRISTRRPYDDPGVSPVYYRLLPELETIVDKTHLPYALNPARKQRWQQWFFEEAYDVTALPDYSSATAGNPFIVFREIPAASRYRFLLDEAHYTIKNFINGPVCRGPIALSVIRDHFWVFFTHPQSKQETISADFLSRYEDELALPSAEGNIYTPLTTWLKYSNKQKRYLSDRDRFLSDHLNGNSHFGLHSLWQGEQENPNVALTIFRHYDSASVEKGLLGGAPQTAWVLDYPLLERIHYLLVAGYDVYGNVGHQLLSRLHMDFLRMEGEANFLMFLPQQTREKERQAWYRQADKEVLRYLTHPSLEQKVEPAIVYTTDDHKAELFQKIRSYLSAALEQHKQLDAMEDQALARELQPLASFTGNRTTLLPEVTFVEIYSESSASAYFTLIRNNAHLNMTALLSEKKTLLPEENTITLARGLIGSYPNAFIRVARKEVSSFVASALALQDENDYRALMDAFGMRRTSPEFWWFSDKLHAFQRQQDEVEFGLFDLNRLENR